MKRIPIFACAMLLATCALAQDTPEETAAAEQAGTLTTDQQREGYAIGMNVGNGLRQQGITIDVESLVQGLRDAYAGTETQLSEEEMQQTMMAFQQRMMQEQQAKMEQQGQANAAASEEFLKQNAAREGVQTTASGLQYEIVAEGSGTPPSATDRVTVHYTGTLPDGTVFDSSVERGQPVTFPVGGVIRGWTEALQLMKPGAKWKLYIPADLAYGPRGAGAKIGPNQALVFDVELISVESGEAQTPAVQPPPAAE